jgi:hypothetical protein
VTELERQTKGEPGMQVIHERNYKVYIILLCTVNST